MNPSVLTPYTLLVVEDDPSAASLMVQVLCRAGLKAEQACSGEEAHRKLESTDFDCVVVDLTNRDGAGCALRSKLQKRPDPPPLIIVTADDRAESAVHAMRAGAADYLVKRPGYLARLADAVIEVLQPRSRLTLPTPYGEPIERSTATSGLLGMSRSMAEVRRRVLTASRHDVSVLITGETGTGKEVVAQALHAGSNRRDLPFVPVNCATIASSLFESELFGSTRGAFTGASRDRNGLFGEASGGTIFLDEIGELPIESQAKLLRVLESGSFRSVGSAREKKVDVRVIAATNRDLSAAVAHGRFRRDLYYRLDVLTIHMPPLRERLEDLPVLVEHFMGLEARGKERRAIRTEALRQLKVHDWPGNVRELKHTISRTLLWGGDGAIDHFEFTSTARLENRERSGKTDESSSSANSGTCSGACQPPPTDWIPSSTPPQKPRKRHDLRWSELADALMRNQGRLAPAAMDLDISVRTLQRRMREIGMKVRDFLE